MTREEAAAHQAELAKHYDLSYWYGTNCKKCCGVYPKFKHSEAFGGGCWYECEVCGTRTNEVSMPWIAAEQWNHDEVIPGNFSLF